jgi:hypothetical protein
VLRPLGDDLVGLLGVGAVLLEHGLHAGGRHLLGEALERFGEQGIRREVLLGERDGRVEEGRRRRVAQAGLPRPIDDRAHLLNVDAGRRPPVEKGLHVGRLGGSPRGGRRPRARWPGGPRQSKTRRPGGSGRDRRSESWD